MLLTGGRKLFREFLRSEYSEENMLFWLACEELKTENNPELVEEKARLIYEDYISILSPKEVGEDAVDIWSMPAKGKTQSLQRLSSLCYSWLLIFFCQSIFKHCGYLL